MKAKKVLITAGIILIFIGLIFHFVSNNKEKNDNKENTKEETLLINTSKKEGNIIDNSNYEKVVFDDTTEIYFYDFDLKYKYYFMIPKDMKETQLSLYSKHFESDTLEVHTQVYNDSVIGELITLLKTKYLNTTYNYSLGENITRINDYDVSYMYVQSNDNDNYEECYQIYIEVGSNQFVVIEFISKNRTFDDKTLNEIFNAIKVEKNIDELENNKVEGEYLLGNLKQIHPLNNKIYNVSYKVDKSKYEVLESNVSSFDRVTFKSKNEKEFLVLFEMFYDTIDLKNQLDGYIKSRAGDKKIVQFNITEEDIDGRKYSYYLVETDEEENRYYFNYVYFIDNDFSYIISFKSNSKDESIITDFYDIKVNVN